jgi:hypothetical protein
MNNLSHGFLFLSGLTWLLCEVCVSAGAGFWTPLWLFLIGFTVMFAIMGCLPLSERAINTAGPIFTLVIGASIALYGFGAFGGGFLGGFLRLVGGLALVLLGVFSLLSREKAQAH